MAKRRGRGASGNGPLIALLVGAVALLGLFGYAISQSLGPSVQMGKNEPAGDCVPSPVTVSIPGLERVPCKSNQHVSDGTTVKYETDPPLSGDHYAAPLPAGWYGVPQPSERIVHSLEHGAVVIYYDKDRLSEKELGAVQALTIKYPGVFDGVLAVPRTDPQSALILTAWEHMLPLRSYDGKIIDQFVGAFRGRGPENPVR